MNGPYHNMISPPHRLRESEKGSLYTFMDALQALLARMIISIIAYVW